LVFVRITWFGFYCGLMLSASAFCIDIILPAFAGLSTGLNTSTQQVQLVVPVYLFGLGLAQPFFGALSDRYGRKPGIYLGLVIFLIGGTVCLLSYSLHQMLIGRLLQGVGAAAGVVICRAMMRDSFSGAALAQQMAVASMFFAMGPVLAPLIGYGIYAAVGWRGIFVFLMIFSTALAWITHLQEETLAPELRRKSGWREIGADFSAVYKHPQSRFFIVVGVFSMALIVSFLEHAHVVYTKLGADSGRFAFLFALSSAGIIFGQIVNHSLIQRIGAIGATRVGSLVVTVTTLIILTTIFFELLTVSSLTVLLLGFHTSFLIIYSNVLSLALDPHRQRAGAASAVFGFTGYLIGSSIAALVTLLAGEDLTRWALCFFALAAVIAICVWCWRPSSGERQQDAV